MSKGMASNPSVRWFKATPKRQELLMVSELHSTLTHWDPMQRRSRRCAGRECYCCTIGMPKILRFVAMGVDDRGNDWLVEFRERHRERLNSCISEGGKLSGWRVVIRKEGTAINSAVSIELLVREYAAERDIARLVDLLYLPAVQLGEPANVEDPTSRLR